MSCLILEAALCRPRVGLETWYRVGTPDFVVALHVADMKIASRAHVLPEM